MTLSTHIVTGVAAAKIFSTNPVEAFLIGMATHYALDSIVHWDYKIHSLASESGGDSFSLDKKIKFNKLLFLDISKVMCDVLLGGAIVFLTLSFGSKDFDAYSWILIAGALGGVAPDFLQFVYGVWKIWPLRKLQEFHNYMHAKKKLDGRPMIGVPIQIGIIALMATILFLQNF